MSSKTSKMILGMACVAAMSCGGSGGNNTAPQSFTFALSELSISPVSGGMAAGFDLDNAAGMTPASCNQPDYTNSNGANIDNGFAKLYTDLGSLIDGALAVPGCTSNCLSPYIRSKLAAGDFAILIRLTDVNSVTNDDSVGVEVFVKANVCATPGCLTSTGGALAANNTFTVTAAERVSMTTGRIAGGRLQADIGQLTIPIMASGINLTLAVGSARMAANVASSGLSNVTIGGWVSTNQLNEAAQGTQLAGAIGLLAASADGVPCAGASPACAIPNAMCRDMSLGANATGVTAMLSGI